MLEALKGLSITDPKFYVPIIIGVVLLFIVIRTAKKMAKLAVFIAVVALVALVYFNLPSVSFDGTKANIKVSGQEYVIDARNAKIEASKNAEGRENVYLVSGTTRIELPFSKDYAERFIMDKIKQKLTEKAGTAQ